MKKELALFLSTVIISIPINLLFLIFAYTIQLNKIEGFYLGYIIIWILEIIVIGIICLNEEKIEKKMGRIKNE